MSVERFLCRGPLYFIYYATLISVALEHGSTN